MTTVHHGITLVLAIALSSVSCGKRAQPVDSGTDDAKLRPEVAAAREGASPSPTFGQTDVGPTPSP